MTFWQRLLSWFRPAPVRHPSQVGPVEPFSANDIAARHNAERARLGVAPLLLDAKLTARASIRAINAADASLTQEHLHDGFELIPGDHLGGENAEIGSPDAASVMAVWMGSAGHRPKILDPRFSRMGAGRAMSADMIAYWYVVFAG
jgi:uncharacterized protein YkwD